MQIKSNKCLLKLISKHRVGIIYPNLIPYITRNIVLQGDNTIFDPEYYRRFENWFYWEITREGHDFWCWVDKTL